jgi:uncharacterized membrane protein YedE/YeeE
VKKLIGEFWYALPAGLIIGAIFGFILQRGRFCMNSAFRDILLLKEFKLAKAVVVALAVAMVGFAIFAISGVIDLAPRPLTIWAAIIGGLIFGIGMVLAAGCASGTTYRVGEGMMGSFVAAIGLTAGAIATNFGLLSQLRHDIQHVVIGEDGDRLTVLGVFDPDLTPLLLLIVGIIGIALIFYFWGGWSAIKRKMEAKEPLLKFDNFTETVFKKGYPWWATGILIGIIATVGYIASNNVLGITGGWMDIERWFTTTDSIMWPGFIILGAILGSFISAYIAGEFKFRVPKEGFTLVKQFIGGLLMGFGAVVAMGCNITNILGGVPQLSLHSIITGLCIIGGSWIAAYLLFMWREE